MRFLVKIANSISILRSSLFFSLRVHAAQIWSKLCKLATRTKKTVEKFKRCIQIVHVADIRSLCRSRNVKIFQATINLIDWNRINSERKIINGASRDLVALLPDITTSSCILARARSFGIFQNKNIYDIASHRLSKNPFQYYFSLSLVLVPSRVARFRSKKTTRGKSKQAIEHRIVVDRSLHICFDALF